MSGEKDLGRLISEMTPKLNKGIYVFVSIKDINQVERSVPICEFKEQEGYTIVLEKKLADAQHFKYDYIASWITLKIHSSLEAAGLTAVFASVLAEHNISCNVISAYYHDHIFVAVKDADNAMKVLQGLSS
jgi:hypothetical protein